MTSSSSSLLLEELAQQEEGDEVLPAEAARRTGNPALQGKVARSLETINRALDTFSCVPRLFLKMPLHDADGWR